MGCGNSKKPMDKSKIVGSHVSPVEPPKQNLQPPNKLTVAEIQKKRSELRNNLEQGNYTPPTIHIPKIQPIESY